MDWNTRRADILIGDEQLTQGESHMVAFAVTALSLSLQVSDVGGDIERWIACQKDIARVRERIDRSARLSERR